MTTTVKILVEKNDGMFTATAYDDVGSVASASRDSILEAVHLVRKRCRRILDGDLEFNLQRFSDGGTNER